MMWRRRENHAYFNTSYVTVQHQYPVIFGTCGENFNTSYVTVQREMNPINASFQEHFNTSYVTVQRRQIGLW